MPLYEFGCSECGRRSTILVLAREGEAAPRCRHCGSDALERLLSGFAIHRTDAQRMQDLDASGRQDESYYRDNRNIGLRAKKRMKELGVDLGDAFEEKIEKARTSKLEDLVKD